MIVTIDKASTTRSAVRFLFRAEDGKTIWYQYDFQRHRELLLRLLKQLGVAPVDVDYKALVGRTVNMEGGMQNLKPALAAA